MNEAIKEQLEVDEELMEGAAKEIEEFEAAFNLV